MESASEPSQLPQASPRDDSEEFLYNIDYLPKIPVRQLVSAADLAEIGCHIRGLVILQLAGRKGRNILLGT